MNLLDALDGAGTAGQAAAVNPPLDLNVRLRFQLQVALPGVLAVVALESSLDFDRVSVVPLDEIAVVAVH